MKKQDQQKYAQIGAKAWIDPKFKSKLIASPEATLKENGIDSKGMKCKVVEAQKNEFYFVIPAKPEGNLSETELKNVAAAGSVICNPLCGGNCS